MAGTGQWSVFQDMIDLLHYMERAEWSLCGAKSRCVYMLRETCCVQLRHALDILQDNLCRVVPSNHQRGELVRHGWLRRLDNLTDKLINSSLPASLNRKLSFDKQVGRAEVVDRFRMAIIRAVDHVCFNAEKHKSNLEVNYSKGLLMMLLNGLSSILQKPRCGQGLRDWTIDWSQYHSPDSADALRSMFWTCKETLQTQLVRLLLFLSNPVQDSSVLYHVVRTLHDDPSHEQIFKVLPANDSFNFK